MIGTKLSPQSLAIALLLLGAAAAASAQWTARGPDGGWVTAMAADPVHTQTVYAGTQTGVFVSRDAGASWQRSGALYDFVAALAVDSAGQAVFAATPDGLRRSVDGGATWSRVNPGSFRVLAADPHAADAVYAAQTYDGGVVRFQTGVETSSFLLESVATSLAVSSGNASTVYAANATGSYRSTDGGRTYAPMTGLDAALGEDHGERQYFVATDPGKPDRVYGFRTTGTGGHLCTSEDGGNGWSCGGNLHEVVTSLVVDRSASPAVLVVGTTEGSFRSSDGGITWQAAAAEGAFGQLLRTADGAILLGTTAGISRSADRGGHWASSSAGLTASEIGALALDPRDPQRLLLSAFGIGLFRSTDAGFTLQPVDRSNPKTRSGLSSIVFDPLDSQTAYGGIRIFPTDGLLKTTDGGEHWHSLGDLSGHSITSLALDPTAPIVYAAVDDAFGRGGVFRSVDGGETFDSRTLVKSVSALILDARHPATLYAGGEWDAGYYYYPSGVVYQTVDNGTTWVPAHEQLHSPVTAMAMDPGNPRKLYAGTGTGLYRSDDGGSSWRFLARTQAHFVNAIAVDLGHPGRVYVGTNAGILRSDDDGESWSPVGTGPPNAIPVSSVALDPSGRHVYAGTAGGGMYSYDIARDPCVPGPTTLCLLGGRFEVTADATDPHRSETVSATSYAQTDRYGYFSLPAFTGDETLPEIAVKMVDATASQGAFWFFYTGLTSLPYTVNVRDSLTGDFRTYSRDGYCGGADTHAFPGGHAASGAQPESERRDEAAEDGELLFLGGRFRATLSATNTRNGHTTTGHPISGGDRYGFFSLPEFTGDPSFPEVLVKMIDGTALPGNAYWLFFTGLTSLPYTLTVTDTVTGRSQTYGNDSASFCGGADTQTFGSSDSTRP